MWRSDDPYLLWLVITLMLVVAWVVMPLTAVFGYVSEQHCLLTVGRREHTAVVNITTAEVETIPRYGNRYTIELTSPTSGFRYFYEGYDGAFDETVYDMWAFVAQLQRLQSYGESVELVWVRAPLFRGDEQLLKRIAGEPIPATCAWWWGPGYALLVAFFAWLSWFVVTAVRTAVKFVDQNPDEPQEAVQQHVLQEAWRRWREWWRS